MDRRTAVKTVATTLPLAIAGCAGGGGEEPTETTGDTETKAPAKTPVTTDTPEPPYVIYYVRNEDDRAHPLDVVVETADGEVIHQQTMAEFAPGEQVSASVAEVDPNEAPYPITISLESLSVTVEWKADECPGFNLSVVINSKGELEVEREACIK